MGIMRSSVAGAMAASEPKPNVLVVDDDAGVANAIGRILVQRGLAVEIVADGATALERIESHSYDVMVLDLRMANLDGLEVLRALRSRPDPPETILHSAFLDVPTTVDAMKCGVSDVIEKPVSPSVLGERVLHLVRKKQSTRVDIPAAGGAGSLDGDPAERLLGETPAIRSLRDQIRRISQFREVSVLIEGHTGTGKELVAEAIHTLTARHEPFVSVNCAAVPDHLFESELFGHEAGAFTSARGARAGLFEEAGQGTIFLDEIGEMPASVQPKLLRVLETREFRRVGGNRSRRLAARVISATNRPLSGAPDDALRSDLYFRLAGYTIVTPQLCDRVHDIPILAVHFLAQFAARYGQAQARFTPAALESLGRYDWPGNVRELRLVIENAAMLAAPGPIDQAAVERVLYTRSGEAAPQPPEHSGSFPASAVVAPGVTLPDLERELIIGAFSKYSPNLSKTAKYLGIPRSTLRDKLRKFGVL